MQMSIIQPLPMVSICCDGNAAIGYGHLRRALTLAAALRPLADVRIVGLSEAACQILGCTNVISHKSKVVIFDTPYPVDDKLRQAAEQGKTTVALDWFGETAPDVNIAVYPHGKIHANREIYVGFEYILIREEIASLHRAPSTQSAESVLVFLGGGDLLNQGHETARLLSRYGLDVTLVQGPLATNRREGEGYRVLVNPEGLPQLLAACDWAVTNGGGCLFETMCLGKAAFVLPQTEAEMKIARFVEERGAVLGIGLDGLRKFDFAELGSVAERGANLVDGRGAERIASIVRGLYESK